MRVSTKRLCSLSTLRSFASMVNDGRCSGGLIGGAQTRDWEQACVVKKTEASPQGANEGLCLGGGCRSRNMTAQRYRVTTENNGIKD
jgi:hypothetical protein